jgi:hypothetical protein
VSPVVAALAAADCPVTGQVFFAFGGRVARMQGWTVENLVERDERWTVDELCAHIGALPPLEPADPMSLL